MADAVKMKPLSTGLSSDKKKRNPASEIDPDTGAPYEDIPGLEYPTEFAVGENLAIGAATGGGGNLIKSAVESAGKKAIGNAVAGEAKDLLRERATTVARDARTNAASVLPRVKGRMPTKDAAQAEAIRNPEFNRKLNNSPEEAFQELQAHNDALAQQVRKVDNTVKLGADVPASSKAEPSYADKLNTLPIGASKKYDVRASDSSPVLDYSGINKNVINYTKPKPPRKP